MRTTIVIILFFLFSCGTQTVLVNSWKDPDASVNPDRLNKVMVAVLSQDEASRRKAEDEMADMNRAFIPSYRVFDSVEAAKDENKAKQILTEENFDGAIIIKLVRNEETERYTPGHYKRVAYRTMHGIYFDNFYSPGYYVQDENYVLSTNVFSLVHDKLLWSGATSTINPLTIEKTISEEMSEVRKQMIKDGFIERL